MQAALHAAAVLGGALAIDLPLGEYPARLHPVVWMGHAISMLERRAPRSGRAAPFAYGLGMALGVPALFAAGAAALLPAPAPHPDGARVALRSLCSRDAAALDGSQLAAAAVESVAENTSDSVVAPLLFWAVLGVPGAVAYRALNTLDARVGYHGAFEWLGKASARLDDLANLVPARLTAALLLGAR